MKLKEQIEKYIPYNEQEKRDKEIMLYYINQFEDVLTRKNTLGHFTASAWVVNPEKTKVLMIYHKQYQSWTWPGGHADGEQNLLETAKRELEEETGIRNAKLLKEDIFSIEVACVNGHIKKGNYVSSHVHLNLTYLFEADEQEVLKIKEDENSGVEWIPIEEIQKVSKEAWMKEWVYPKEVQKIKEIR